jgi:perosamine synthetase
MQQSAEQLAKKLITIIRQATGKMHGEISLHEPSFAGNEWHYVKDCIDSNWVSSAGQYVSRFETMLCDFTGAKHAIATVNGTAALHVCLLLAGVIPQEEVLMPALTFVATANAASYCQAIPHFVDVARSTLGVCPKSLRRYLEQNTGQNDGKCINKTTGRHIKALVVMHCFGHPAELDELKEVCSEFNIVLVEDAAEAIGSYYKGNHVGNHGLLSCLSFNGNKTITTGGGGAILTNDAELAKQARHLTTTGKVAHQWEYFHDCVAYNYRLPNINAALGCAQLEQLDSILTGKRELAHNLKELIAKVPELTFMPEPENCKSNYWLNAVLLNKNDHNYRDALLADLHAGDIKARPAWQLLSSLPMYKNCPQADLTISKEILANLVNLPSSLR